MPAQHKFKVAKKFFQSAPDTLPEFVTLKPNAVYIDLSKVPRDEEPVRQEDDGKASSPDSEGGGAKGPGNKALRNRER